MSVFPAELLFLKLTVQSFEEVKHDVMLKQEM